MSRDPKDLIRLSEAEAKRLARLYMEAEREILMQVDRAMARGNDLRYLRGMLDNVQAILEDLFTGNRQWCEQAIPRVYVAGAEYADGLVSAKLASGFGGIHQQAVKVLADNTFERLESVRQVIGRRSEDLYRQYALEATRQSVIGYKSWQQVAKDFRANLRAEGITGFTDARGREWNMKSYAEMVARTTTMEAHLEGTANRLVEHGHDLVRVSSHVGSCPKCAPYQGKILSLTGRDKDDPRCYATLQEAKDNGLFHPNCRHAYSLFIDLDAEIEALERELGEEEADGVGEGSTNNDANNDKQDRNDNASRIPVKGVSPAAKPGIAKAMSDALQHGLNTHTECLLTLDAISGETVYNQVDGAADSVRLPEQLIDTLKKAATRSVILVHNHPSSSAFSDADISLFGELPSVQGLFVIGHDGTGYYVGKTDATPALTRNALVADYQVYFTNHYTRFNDLVVTGKMQPGEAWKEHSHLIMHDISGAWNLEYERWSEP